MPQQPDALPRAHAGWCRPPAHKHTSQAFVGYWNAKSFVMWSWCPEALGPGWRRQGRDQLDQLVASTPTIVHEWVDTGQCPDGISCSYMVYLKIHQWRLVLVHCTLRQWAFVVFLCQITKVDRFTYFWKRNCITSHIIAGGAAFPAHRAAWSFDGDCFQSLSLNCHFQSQIGGLAAFPLVN